jgi:ribonuclease III
VVATHGAAHNQEFEIECLVPKLDIQVFGTGGSRRAGEQVAAKLALEAVQNALTKSASSGRKSRPRVSQLKLAGIATIQPDAPVEEEKKPQRAAAKTEARNEDAKQNKLDLKTDGKIETNSAADVNADANPAGDAAAPTITTSQSKTA